MSKPDLPEPYFLDQFSLQVAWGEEQVRAIIAKERARADALEAALREALDHFTPQINGMDETCWIVGMRTQLRDDRMNYMRALLKPKGAA